MECRCSTGEEAYTLAMIMQDYFGPKTIMDTRVLATDISGKVLDAAKKESIGIMILNHFHLTGE